MENLMENLNINNPTGFMDLPYEIRNLLFFEARRDLPEREGVIDLDNEREAITREIDNEYLMRNQYSHLVSPEIVRESMVDIQALTTERENIIEQFNNINNIFMMKARELNTLMRLRGENPFR